MSPAGNSNPEPQKRLEIRKYPNRRYYDATRSCHVTLEQIHGLIREGHEVRIIDSKTEHDITPQILAQIIIEMDAPKLGVFPVAMLHRILQSNQDIVQEFVHKYFNEPLSAFLDSQGNMERYVRRAFGIQPSAPTTADWAKMMWGPLNPAFWSTRNAASDAAAGKGASQQGAPAGSNSPAAATPATSPGVTNEQLQSQVRQLSQQLAALQSQLPAGKPRKSPRKRTSKK